MQKIILQRKKTPSVVITSTKTSSLSDITVPSNCISSNNSSSTTSKKDGMKVSVASGRKTVQPRKSAFGKVQIAKNSRRTPNQVKAADIQRNEAISALQAA